MFLRKFNCTVDTTTALVCRIWTMVLGIQPAAQCVAGTQGTPSPF
jgi:hypothetical protein